MRTLSRAARLPAALLSLVLPAGTALSAAPERFTPVPLIVAPSHSEQLFGSTDGVFGTGPVPLPRGDVLVIAVEFERRPVQVARFAVSSDGGRRWRTFAADRRDESLETDNNPSSPRDQVYDAEVGFTARLDTTTLEAGEHLLRVEMAAHGRRGEVVMPVVVLEGPLPQHRIVEPPEPSPVDPVTEPPGANQEEPRLHFPEVAGLHEIRVEPPGLGLLSLDLLEGSPPEHDQGGQGTVDQNALGPNSSKPVVDGAALANMYCAPAAAASTLWRQASSDPRIRRGTKADMSAWLPFIKKCIEDVKAKHPDDPKNTFDYGEEVAAFFADKADSYWVGADGQLTQYGLGFALACKMKTDPVDGTTQANVRAGFLDFLKEQGIDADYTSSDWTFGKDANTAPTDAPHPGKKKLIEEIAKDEMVLVVIVNRKTGLKHVVAGKDYKDDGKGVATISIRDPNGNVTADCPVGKDANGNSHLKYQEVWWAVTDIISWSPTTEARVRFAMDAFRRLVDAITGSFFLWDTLAVHDGFHTLRSTVCQQAACSYDASRVYVNNLPPLPQVQATPMGPMVAFRICDQAGSEDVMSYRGQVGSMPFQGGYVPASCVLHPVGPLPPGNYPWFVELEDYSGRRAAQNGTVNVL